MLAVYQALHAFFLILLVTCEVKSLSHVQLFATPCTAACQASLSFTISWSLLKLMSIESVIPSNHLILFRPLLLPSILPSIRVFSNELAFCIRWSFSTSTYEALRVSTVFYGFPDSSVGKESTCNAGDPCLIPGLGRSTGEGIGYLPSPIFLDFPCGSAGKESAFNAGDLGSIPGLGRSLGEGKGYRLQYSGLENSMDCIVHGVTNSWTQLRNFHFTSLYFTDGNSKTWNN